ncbi:MAG TPA: hypothetical protein GXX48_05050 [Ochrobactrum intermedium]|uniref:Uncharacterized protein n=1 Tax=Brucella intermedia TaxID=94625 RepID=A0A7V6TYS9_9HYPH|nr:hypothetical protein [Brucella intermedia]HHV66997.1 hypothetical protein [Brucella intermedia]
MTTPYPLPRSIRETEWLRGDGRSSYGTFDFKIFDLEDVQVRLRSVGDDGFDIVDVTVSKSAGAVFDTFTVTFPFAIDSDREFQVRGMRLHERTSDLFRGGSLKSLEVEAETSKAGVVLQEVRRDVSDNIGLWHAERAARIAGDLLLHGRIDHEAFIRMAADDVLRSERIAGDQRLQAQVDGINDELDQFDSKIARAEAAAESSENSAQEAHELVQEATSGFVGFKDGIGYDFGFITQTMTYFDRNFGSIADPVNN